MSQEVQEIRQQAYLHEQEAGAAHAGVLANLRKQAEATRQKTKEIAHKASMSAYGAYGPALGQIGEEIKFEKRRGYLPGYVPELEPLRAERVGLKTERERARTGIRQQKAEIIAEIAEAEREGETQLASQLATQLKEISKWEKEAVGVQVAHEEKVEAIETELAPYKANGGYNLIKMMDEGYTEVELVDLGFSKADIKDIKVTLAKQEAIDLKIAPYKSNGGYDITSMLDDYTVGQIESFGFAKEDIEEVKKAKEHPITIEASGVILAGGAPGEEFFYEVETPTGKQTFSRKEWESYSDVKQYVIMTGDTTREGYRRYALERELGIHPLVPSTSELNPLPDSWLTQLGKGYIEFGKRVISPFTGAAALIQMHIPGMQSIEQYHLVGGEAIRRWEKEFPSLGMQAGAFISSPFEVAGFPAAKAVYPTITVKDITKAEWIGTGVNVALWTLPVWLPKAVGGLKWAGKKFFKPFDPTKGGRLSPYSMNVDPSTIKAIAEGRKPIGLVQDTVVNWNLARRYGLKTWLSDRGTLYVSSTSKGLKAARVAEGIFGKYYGTPHPGTKWLVQADIKLGKLFGYTKSDIALYIQTEYGVANVMKYAPKYSGIPAFTRLTSRLGTWPFSEAPGLQKAPPISTRAPLPTKVSPWTRQGWDAFVKTLKPQLKPWQVKPVRRGPAPGLPKRTYPTPRRVGPGEVSREAWERMWKPSKVTPTIPIKVPAGGVTEWLKPRMQTVFPKLEGWAVTPAGRYMPAGAAPILLPDVPFLVPLQGLGFPAYKTTATLIPGQVGQLTPAQIKQLTPQQLKQLAPQQIKQLTPQQMQQLDLAALTTTQLRTLTTTQLEALTTTQLKALTTTQIKSLTSTQVQNLTATQVKNLTSAQVQALTSTQVQSMTATQVKNLTTTQVQALTSTQLESMTSTQLKNLTSTQLKAMTPTQLRTVSRVTKRPPPKPKIPKLPKARGAKKTKEGHPIIATRKQGFMRKNYYVEKGQVKAENVHEPETSGVPSETFEVFGPGRGIKISEDLGVVDNFMNLEKKTFASTGYGLETDVGKRHPSPTKGITVRGRREGQVVRV